MKLKCPHILGEYWKAQLLGYVKQLTSPKLNIQWHLIQDNFVLLATLISSKFIDELMMHHLIQFVVVLQTQYLTVIWCPCLRNLGLRNTGSVYHNPENQASMSVPRFSYERKLTRVHFQTIIECILGISQQHHTTRIATANKLNELSNNLSKHTTK